MKLDDYGFISSSLESEKTKNYEKKYLQDLAVNEKLKGELSISALQDSEYGERFYFWIVSHDMKEKWGIKIGNPYTIKEDGIVKVYAKKGGRLYQFLESFSKATMGEEYTARESRTIDFEKFREIINNNKPKVTVQVMESLNSKADYPNIEVLKVEKDNNQES